MQLTRTGLHSPISGRRSSRSKAVEHAARQTARELIARLESSLPPKEAARAFIAQIVGSSLDDRREFAFDHRTTEAAPWIPDVDAVLAAGLTDIEAFFRRTISVARNNGTVPQAGRPEHLACLLLGVLLGIRVLAHARPDRSLLQGIARSASEFLDMPVGPEKE